MGVGVKTVQANKEKSKKRKKVQDRYEEGKNHFPLLNSKGQLS